MTNDKADGVGRLSEEFLKWFEPHRHRVQTRGFMRWTRSGWSTERRVSERVVEKLLSGGWVRWEHIEAFSIFCSEELKICERDAEEIAEFCQDDPTRRVRGARDPYRSIDPTFYGWHFLDRYLLWLIEMSGDNFVMPEEAYCHGPSDVRFAAELIVRCFGRMTRDGAGDALSEFEALKAGESSMGKLVHEYEEWLSDKLKVEGRSVMFAVLRKGKGQWVRVGASVVLPINDASYDAIRRGHLHPLSLRGTDLVPVGTKLHFNALAKTKAAKSRDSLRQQWAQVLTATYQMAMMCPRLRGTMLAPSLVAFEGAKENADIARANGFVKTGADQPGDGFKVIELCAPEDAVGWSKSKGANQTATKKFPHLLVLHLIQFVQEIFGQEHKQIHG